MTYEVSAISIKDKKILLVEEEGIWMLPGGELKGNGTITECLRREVREKFSGTKLENIEIYGTFGGTTPYSEQNLFVWTYFADIKGELGNPSNEINSKRVKKEDIGQYNLSDVTSRVINSLIGYNKL